mmetsp:Transcript_49536/g.117924  ORF Transcript_49536/g.117924 Transcript_49536/m.117924 type:complete len:799 (-) Transcript_49536:223-2619(-)
MYCFEYCCCRKGPVFNPDAPWAWVFGIGLTLMTVFAILSATVWDGDIRRLTHGFDYKGDLCGVDTSEKYLYWCANEVFNPAEGDQYPDTICHDCRICVSECPSGNDNTLNCPMPNVNTVTESKDFPDNGVTVHERLEMEVVQSTGFQPSYPSESWGGRFCLPKDNDNNIRHEIQDGPYGGAARFGAGIGSLENAWLVFLIVGIISAALAFVFICLISHYAGIVLFLTMIASLAILLFFAVFFLIALFDFTEDQSSWYQNANPLYESFSFDTARGWSVAIGFILLILSAFLLCFTCRSIKRIDETMGMVSAATDAIHQNKSLYIIPYLMCILFFVAVGLMLAGLLLAYSVGRIKHRIKVNGKELEGLEEKLDSPWWMWLLVALFAVMIWWTIETIFALTQLMTSAVIWKWWLCKSTRQVEGKKQSSILGKHHNHYVNARVSGVDRVQDPRQTAIEKTPYGQVMVAPVGSPLPGYRDGLAEGQFELTYKAPPKTEKNGDGLCAQLCEAFKVWRHFGSACWGAIWVGLTRIPRWIGHFIGVEFVYDHNVRKKASYEYSNPDSYEAKAKTSMWNGCGRAFMWIENILGFYNGDGFTELLLFWGLQNARDKDAHPREVHYSSSGNTRYGFIDACRNAFDDIQEAHGAVSFLKGALTLYEVMAAFLAFWISLAIALLMVSYIWWWNDEDSDWYVDDPALTVIVAGIIGFIATFLVMIVLTQTAEAMLYIFNYYRMRGHGKMEPFVKGTQLPGVLGNEIKDRPDAVLGGGAHRTRAANLLIHEEGEGNEAVPLLGTFLQTHRGGH